MPNIEAMTWNCRELKTIPKTIIDIRPKLCYYGNNDKLIEIDENNKIITIHREAMIRAGYRVKNE